MAKIVPEKTVRLYTASASTWWRRDIHYRYDDDVGGFLTGHLISTCTSYPTLPDWWPV